MGFTVEVFQNEYLPEGGREVNAIVTVTAAGDGQAGEGPGAVPTGQAGVGQGAVATGRAGAGQGEVQGQPDRAEIIIIDCSGSMDYPHAKILQARAATAAAIDVIGEGVAFAVIAGTEVARPVFPLDGSLARASAASREAAKQQVTSLRPAGGTAMGTWLRLADQMFGSSSAALRHAILLTDGKNEHETPEQLSTAIAACEGVFSCDCRGVGTDWVVAELRKIATRLLGTVDIVADPGGLAADFEAMMQTAMGKQLPDVMLRVWTPQHAELRFVKQVAPTLVDLTDRRAAAGAQVGSYPTGAWADGESRDYHVCVRVAPAAIGQEMLAARVSLVAGGDVLGQQLVRAVWTSDEALSTKINANVAHYTGQAELAQAIQDGLEARKHGDEETATAKLGRAVALAEQSGNEDTAKLLAKVVDVVDAATGTVRLKHRVDDADEMALDTRSTKTVRTRS